MRLAGVVILYNPESEVVKNIETYAGNLDKLFIIDNSENPNTDVATQFEKIKNATYIPHYDNQGIASRLNEAAHIAISQGFTHLLTMDQDSSFSDGQFATYVKKCQDFLWSACKIDILHWNKEKKNRCQLIAYSCELFSNRLGFLPPLK